MDLDEKMMRCRLDLPGPGKQPVVGYKDDLRTDINRKISEFKDPRIALIR